MTATIHTYQPFGGSYRQTWLGVFFVSPPVIVILLLFNQNLCHIPMDWNLTLRFSMRLELRSTKHLPIWLSVHNDGLRPRGGRQKMAVRWLEGPGCS
jgi:hypothetical protein